MNRHPTPLMNSRLRQRGSLRRVRHQCTLIPSCESVKVTNTLIAYRTTRIPTRAPVPDRISTAASPIAITPSCVTRRALRLAKRRGSQRSVAIVASTRGPSIKPVCAATNSSAPSVSSVNVTIGAPTLKPPSFQPTRSGRTARR